MTYESNVSFRGDASKALDFVAESLVSVGFNLKERTGSSLAAIRRKQRFAKNPGGPGPSDLLLSHLINVRVDGATISADVQWGKGIIGPLFGIFGGTSLFCLLISAIVFFLQPADRHHHPVPRSGAIVPLLMGIVVGAMVMYLFNYLRTQAHSAIDTLLNNAAAMAGNKDSK